jgi:DNA polymerase alpha subunit A
MHFYLLHLETINDSTVIIHAKALEDAPEGKAVDAASCATTPARIRIENIISPVLMKPCGGRYEELRSEVEEYARSKHGDCACEAVHKTNVFYHKLDTGLDMMKVTLKRRIDFREFSSEHVEFMVGEFLNPIENLIISRGLKGPCVVRIDDFTISPTKEVVVKSPENIAFVCHSALPRMVYGALALEFSGADVLKYSLSTGGQVYSGAIRSPYADENSRAEGLGFVLYPTQGALLNHLNALIKKEGVDCLAFHNLPSGVQRKLDIGSRIRCDLFVFASGNIKGRDYSIEEMAASLGVGLQARGTRDGYLGECSILVSEAAAMLEIFHRLDAMQLSKEMAEISGYILNRTFQNLRAERIEYTLLHELYERKYLFPPGDTKRDMKYSGGLVLTPLAGFYEDLVLLLDFNSLYPSVIQEFNVCFSTVGHYEEKMSGDLTEEQVAEMTSVARSSEQGLLPRILSSFVRRRRAVKDLIKQCRSPEEAKVLDIRQRALKLTANSIYGCLGFTGCRFCNYAMAAYITNKGRELLLETKKIAEVDLRLKVVYGDTDSVMIHTGLPGISSNYSTAIEQADCLKRAINSKYRNIEIEVDRVFKKLLLHTKKKYAGLSVGPVGETDIECKGLDSVRKDFCRVSSRTLQRILELLLLDFEDPEVYRRFYEDAPGKRHILNDGNEKIRDAIYDELLRVANELQTLPVTDFVIHNTLSKPPEKYNAAAALPHVSLALRLKERGMKFEQDDVVSYVIGATATKQPLHKRAFHVSEDFVIDYNYYITSQILPPIFRLVQTFKNIHPQKIAAIFGVTDLAKTEPRKVVTFIMPCCESVQEPALSCRECSKAIPAHFYECKVIEMLRKEVAGLYSAVARCTECGVSSYSHLPVCFNCNSELAFTSSNQEFDSLLTALQASFAPLRIPEINEVLTKYMQSSEYRKIDLGKYFKDEIKAL